jgi:hypothetical protein
MLACCAFAVFLLNQLVLPLRWLAARLPQALRPRFANAAVNWSPDAPAPTPRAAVRRGLGALIALEALLAALALAAAPQAAELVRRHGPPTLALLDMPLCRTLIGAPK